VNYTGIEDDIVARLAPLVTAGYEVEAMPNNEAANIPPKQRGRVTVQVGMSKFGEHRSITAAVVQEEDIYVDIILRARTLRATGGIYDLCELSRRLLIGFTPDNCRLPLSGVDFGGISPAELQDSLWTYALRLKTQTISVGAADEDVTPLITAITFDDQTTTAPPPSAGLFASASLVENSGDSVILAWITSGGDEVTISGIGVVDAIGSATVQVTGDVTYTLTLTQGVTVITQVVTLGVAQPDATYTLINTATPPATLDSGTIPSGGDLPITAPPVTVKLVDTDDNELAQVTAPSGVQTDVTAPDATLKLNNSPTTYPIRSGELYNMLVRRNGTLPVTFSFTPSTKTLNFIAPEPLDGEYDGTQAPIYYMGWTEDGTTYIITRITRNPDETVITAEAVGAWADRYTLNYQ